MCSWMRSRQLQCILYLWWGSNVTPSLFLSAPFLTLAPLVHLCVPVCLLTRWSSSNRIPAPPSVCTRCSTWTQVMRCTPTATTTTCRSASTQTSAEIRKHSIERIQLNGFWHTVYTECGYMHCCPPREMSRSSYKLRVIWLWLCISGHISAVTILKMILLAVIVKKSVWEVNPAKDEGNKLDFCYWVSPKNAHKELLTTSSLWLVCTVVKLTWLNWLRGGCASNWH